MKTQFINLNMTPSGINPTFHIAQYDVGRLLGFYVYNGSEVVDLDGYTCTIEATRTDGTQITADVITTDNQGVFAVTAEMSNEADKYACQLVIIDRNANRIASLPFIMDVITAALNGNAESIGEDRTLYQQYNAAMQAALANEANDRINADNLEKATRQSAVNTLQGNILNAVQAEKSERVNADNSLSNRISQNDARINNLVGNTGNSNSEIVDARVGVDGSVYSNLGTAIRTSVNNLKEDLIKHNTSWINGKRIGIIGDSISTFAGYIYDGYHTYYPAGDVQNVNETWWKRILNASGAELSENLSYGGSGITKIEGRPGLYDRTKLLTNPDVAIICLGVNDANANVPLGNPDYETDYTELSETEVLPAYIKGIKAIMAVHPDCTIICVNIIKKNTYAEEIEKVCKKLGVVCISVCDYDTRTDKIHPTYAGMHKIAYTILRYVEDSSTKVINESFSSQISQIKRAVSDYILLPRENYTYVEGKNTGFDVAKKVLTHNPDNYAAYAQIDVTPGEKYIIYCGGVKSTSATYPVVMLAFSKDGTSYLSPENHNYDPFAGVSENTKTKVNGYSVTVPEDAKYMFVSTSSKGGMPIVIRKYEIKKSAEYNGILGETMNTSGKQYGINDLTFLLQNAQRHFFDLNKICYDIVPNEKMFTSNSNIYPTTDVQNAVDIACDSKKIRFGYWGDGTAESYKKISSVHPFRVYEVDFKDVVTRGTTCRGYINFMNPSGGRSFSLDMNFKSGVMYFAGQTITTNFDITSGNFTARLYIMRTSVALFFINDANGCVYVNTFDISSKADMCDPNTASEYSMCIGAVLTANSKFEISRIKSYITCGCAQADVRILKDFECNPIISDGKAYLSMSCRGYSEGYGESYCGIFSFDLDTLAIELTGQIFTEINGIEHPCVGTAIIFDTNTSEWHLFYSDRHGTTKKDPRFGKTVFTNEVFSHPFTDTSSYEWIEDPDVFYDKTMNRYYMVVSVKEVDDSSISSYPYSVAFLESNAINGPYTLLSKTQKTLGGTGTSWVLINGDLYATSGTNTDGIAVFNGRTYEKLQDLKLDVSYGGFRSWGCIVPVYDGLRTKYALITFDRNRGYGTFSYGNIFVYLSNRANTGADFSIIKHVMLE